MKKTTKYIFVIGGVMSGVGKGIASSSIGKVLQAKGFKVNPIKIDPYLNVDAGTMNPTEHGEVFVLNSGLETDQDMGNYERFMEIDLGNENYMTSGMVYKTVIEKERALQYNGHCVEALPHIPDEIISRIQTSAKKNDADISLIEIGGTVGDYQNIMFMEAARRLWLKHPGDVIFILVSYLPVPSKLGEMKTKPTQTAVHQLNSYGIQPHMLIARSATALDAKRKEKLAIWCNIMPEDIISAPDIESVYDVVLNFEKDKTSEIILQKLGLVVRKKEDGLKEWKKFVAKTKNGERDLNIAVVGKYFDTGDFFLSDAYLSVIEATKFSAYSENSRAKLTWINSKEFETGKHSIEILKNFDGIIVPGGFGSSGIEGVISTIQYARVNKIPFLGLCYGMQLSVVEFARNIVGWKDANTTEIDQKTSHPVIDIMPDQKKLLEKGEYGASMRLGAYPAILTKNTIAYEAYLSAGALAKEDRKYRISERHRHRYEVNPKYIAELEKAGLIFSGRSPDGHLMEIAELPKDKHPFFLGTQFHPEFLAHPLSPHPLFTAFIKACIAKNKK